MCLGVPGRLEEISDAADPLTRQGVVSFAGVRRPVSLAYLPEAKVGDYLIVHVGFALSVVCEQEALRAYAAMSELRALEPR